MSQPSKIPFYRDGNMSRLARRKNWNKFIWRANGPVKRTFIILDYGSRRKVSHIVLKSTYDSKLYYMFFKDFIDVAKNKKIENGQFSGIFIGVQNGSAYGMAMHSSDPDYSENKTL